MFVYDYTTYSQNDTEELGKRFSVALEPGTEVAMYGGLGAGKTAFTRGVLRGLGYEGTVSSPTFAIVNEYRGGRLDLAHFDMYRISTEDTGLHSIFDTVRYSGDVFLRDRTADNCRLKLIGLVTVNIHRCEDNLAVTVLTTSTGLLSVLGINFNFLGDSFLISNLRCSDIGLNVELTKKSVYDDIEVELTHAGDDRLACLCIGCNTECGILFSKLCKSLAHLVLTCFGLGLDSDIDNGLRELHGL